MNRNVNYIDIGSMSSTLIIAYPLKNVTICLLILILLFPRNTSLWAALSGSAIAYMYWKSQESKVNALSTKKLRVSAISVINFCDNRPISLMPYPWGWLRRQMYGLKIEPSNSDWIHMTTTGKKVPNVWTVGRGHFTRYSIVFRLHSSFGFLIIVIICYSEWEFPD